MVLSYQYVVLHFHAGFSDNLLCIYHRLSEPGTLPAPGIDPANVYMTKGIQKLSEISFRGRTFPRWLVNAGIAVCFLIIIGGAIEMVYIRALPVYLETGLVLE